MNNIISQQQNQQQQQGKKLMLPSLTKNSSKDSTRKGEDTFAEEKMKQQLRNLEKFFLKKSNESAKQQEKQQPTPLQNIKKKDEREKIEKVEEIRKDSQIDNQEVDTSNTFNQIGLSIQQKKMTQQLKRLEKYTSQPILTNSQNSNKNPSPLNGNLNQNSSSISNANFNQNNNNNNNINTNSNNINQNNSNYTNNNPYNNSIIFDSVGQKRDIRRISNQNNNYNNFINTYLSCFNGENFTQFIKKYDKDSLTVYDCFMNLNPQIPFHITSENKRKIRNLIERYKNINKQFNNSAFRYERNVMFKEKNFKIFDKFHNLSDKDKFNLIRMGNFPSLKLFPTVSTLKYEIDDSAILFDSKFESGNLRRVYKRSLYEKGLRPVVFSQKSFEEKGEKWHRDCENIQYSRNEFKRINFSNMISSNNIFIYQQLNQNNQQQNNNNSINNTQQNNAQNLNNNNNLNYNSNNTNNTNNNNSNNNNNNNNKKRNNYRNSNMPPVYYSTLSFTYTYKYDDDTVYFAHSVPYTYSSLTHYLSKLHSHQPVHQFYKIDSLTTTLIGNKIFCITITENINEPEKIHEEKKEVVICSRVHPGETNASWIMKGMLDFLLSDHEVAANLRRKFIFKMIPMLNPDGVRYGNYRCCLFGNDLNRKWKKALEYIHAPIHSVKELLKKIQQSSQQEPSEDSSTTASQSSSSQSFKANKKIELFCDIHGHSKSMGAFIYGCQYKSEDETQEYLFKTNTQKEVNNSIKVFPYLYSQRKDYFSFEKCSFAVQKDKLGTARIVGFQELSILKSYTLECSFLGFKNPQINGQIEDNLLEMKEEDFEEVGREFLITLYMTTEKDIMKQTMDLFTFKDQQINNTQILMEDLQKRIKTNEPFEMNLPQFLITGSNFRQNDKSNVQFQKKNSIQFTHKSVIQENNENNSNQPNSNLVENNSNSANIPKAISIQKKKSFGFIPEVINQSQQDYLTERIKSLQQIKSQKSIDQVQINSPEGIINKNKQESNQVNNSQSYSWKQDLDLINNQKKRQSQDPLTRDYLSYNFLAQQLHQGQSKQENKLKINSLSNSKTYDRLNSQDNNQNQLKLSIQDSSLKNIINITSIGLNSPLRPSLNSIKNSHKKQNSFEQNENGQDSKRNSVKPNQNNQQINNKLISSVGQNINISQIIMPPIDLSSNQPTLQSQLEQSQTKNKNKNQEQSDRKGVSIHLSSPQKRTINSIHLSNINMPLIFSPNQQSRQTVTLPIIDNQLSDRSHLNQLPNIDHFATVNDVDSILKTRNDENTFQFRDYNISINHGNTTSSIVGQNQPNEQQLHLPRFDSSKKSTDRKSMVISSSSNSISRKAIDNSGIIIQQPNQQHYKKNYLSTLSINNPNQVYQKEFTTIFLNQTQSNTNKCQISGGGNLLKSNISSVENQLLSCDSPNLINNQYSNQQQYLTKVQNISSHTNPLNRMQYHQQHYFKKNRTNIQLGNQNVQSTKQNSNVNCKSQQNLLEQSQLKNDLITISQIPSISKSQTKKISNQLMELETVQSTLSQNSKIPIQNTSKSQSLVLQHPYLQTAGDKKQKKENQIQLQPEYPYNSNSNATPSHKRYQDSENSAKSTNTNQNDKKN